MRKVLTMGVVIFMIITLAACAENYADLVDYNGSDEFEEAIKNGEGVEGKYVVVMVRDIEPDSAFGYNIKAGNNLNFVDAENPNATVDDYIMVKVEGIANMFGSYIITYSEHKTFEASEVE